MRLSEEKIKVGILHPDRDVRDAAAMYFSKSVCRDTSILPLAIQAIEKYGWQHTFNYSSAIEGLPLSGETLSWSLKELQQNNFQGDTIWQGTLARLICKANVGLLARHKSEVLEILDKEDRNTIDTRLDLLDVDAETCWRELDALCQVAKSTCSDPDATRGDALIEAIARHGNAERVLSFLAKKNIDLDDYGEVWMEMFMVGLAGEMRLEAAVPHIIAKINEAEEHADLLFEDAEQALVEIGTDAAVEGAAALFSSDWTRRISACQVFQHIHSDLAVAKALEQLSHEKDATIKAWLAQGLTSQFAYEGIEQVRQVILEDDYDESVGDLRRDLIVAATLMEVDLPEKEQWRAGIEKDRAERKTRLQPEPPEEYDEEYEEEPLLPPKRKVGRNDPCPCGSGKKFKKCCIKKHEGDLFG